MALTEAQKELNKRFRKHKITSRKFGGDDMYSHAVFVNGNVFVAGLGRSEVSYYKRRALEECEKAEA